MKVVCRSGVDGTGAKRYKSEFCRRDLEAAKREAKINALMNKNTRLEGCRQEAFPLPDVRTLVGNYLLACAHIIRFLENPKRKSSGI